MSLGGSIGRYVKCSLDKETIRRESWSKQSKLDFEILIRTGTFIALPTSHRDHSIDENNKRQRKCHETCICAERTSTKERRDIKERRASVWLKETKKEW